jgi:hypothetical protein
MKTARRSCFLQIATICLAVFLSYTARMAASVGEAIPGTPPCPSKVAAESPAPQKKLAQRIDKSIRPHQVPSYQTSLFSADLGADPTRTTNALAEQSLRNSDQGFYRTPQSLPYILRV